MNINPSANGWIDKYFLTNPSNDSSKLSDIELHRNIRNSGFIYGHTINLFNLEHLNIKGLTSEELTKLALLHNLYLFYCKTENCVTTDPDHFISLLLDFYSKIHPKPNSFLSSILPEAKNSIKLEKIINIRITTNNNFFTKSFSHIITNVFLYIDVLAFRKYLINQIDPLLYIEKAEKVVTKVAFASLDAKNHKNTHDLFFLKLFDNSLRTTKRDEIQKQFKINLEFFNSTFERNYFLDISCMAMWSDSKIELSEINFVQFFAKQLEIPSHDVDEALENIFYFIDTYKNEIPYFNYSNPVKHFYDNTSSTVVNLLIRNKNRLVKEVLASGELMKLLIASTNRSLNDSERKKVKKQLIEICKTIPSLAIFALPGGSLLLPILIKFVPDFLPNSFNENLDTDNITTKKELD